MYSVLLTTGAQAQVWECIMPHGTHEEEEEEDLISTHKVPGPALSTDTWFLI